MRINTKHRVNFHVFIDYTLYKKMYIHNIPCTKNKKNKAPYMLHIHTYIQILQMIQSILIFDNFGRNSDFVGKCRNV